MYPMIEHEGPKNHFEAETYRFVAVNLKNLVKEWGVQNLYGSNEVVLFTRELGVRSDLTLIADNRPDRFFLAVSSGHYLPSPNRLYSSGYQIFQLDGGVLNPYLLRAGLDRLPIAGRIIVWDKKVSIDDAIMAGKELIAKEHYRGENRPKAFIPQTYSVEIEFEKAHSFFPLPRGISPEETLQFFDRPELLAFRKNPYGNEVLGLILEREQDYFTKRDAIVNQILLEKGLDWGRINSLSPYEKKTKLKEIETETTRRLEENNKAKNEH